MGFVGTRVILEFHDYSASFEGFEHIRRGTDKRVPVYCFARARYALVKCNQSPCSLAMQMAFALSQQKKSESANITAYAARYIARDQLVCAQSQSERNIKNKGQVARDDLAKMQKSLAQLVALPPFLNATTFACMFYQALSTGSSKYARANELLLILKLVFASSDRILFARALLASSNEPAVPAHAEALYNDEILKLLYAGGARVSRCVSTTHNGVEGHNGHAAQCSPTCIHAPRADVIAAVRATMTALGQFCMQFYDIRSKALEEKAENNEKRIGRALATRCFLLLARSGR
uniref:Uncharacterized protein n=1 Tax=Trichogramma kaykai TaxID=54128 RepID=A0ABD2W3R2_9HYME